ncbi:MAG: hypothetical protein HEP71_00510 [Roseivirga sp.]|nr:hypothetical protein [Roseivirga sp.]
MIFSGIPSGFKPNSIASGFFNLLLIASFLFLAKSESYGQVSLKGSVVSEEGKEIPFVRIGIIETRVALMSDIGGNFELQIPDQYKNRSLTFQVPGFKTRSVLLSDLIKESNPRIVLVEDIIVLNDIVVSNKRLKRKVIGNDGERKGSDVDNDFKGDINMAYAIKAKGRKAPYVVTKLSVLVRNPYSHPYYIRPLIMTYDEETGKPGKNLLSENIYFEVEEGRGWMDIDLEGYNVTAEGTIVIGVEWLGTSGEVPYFSISYDFGKAESFRRTMTSEGFKATGKSNWLPYNSQRKRPLIKAEIEY